MGVRLIVEVLDGAPDTLTFRELYVLLVLAENARDSTRQCWPGIEDDPRIVGRLRMGRSQRYGAIAALVRKDALRRVKRGQKHVRAVYAIPRYDAQGPENPDPDESLSVRETGTLSDSQRPDSEASASGFSGLSVRETRTPSPQSPQIPSSEVTKRIITVIQELSGQRVSDAYAAEVAKKIGPGKANTLAFIEKCIRNDPVKFLPTPQPPRFTAANGFES